MPEPASRPARRLLLAGLVPLLLGPCFLLAGCSSNDNCYWEWYCYIGGGGLDCVWIWRCPGDADPSSDALSAEATAWDAGDDRLDLRVELSGTPADDGLPLSVWLLGPSSRGLRARAERTVWWFHDFPADLVQGIDAEVAGTDLRVVLPVPAAGTVSSPACDIRAVLDLDALAAVPSTASVGDPLFFAAPTAAALGLPGPNLGLVAALTPPDGAPPVTLYLREGESADLPANRPGRWTVSLILVTEGLCEPDSVDAVYLARVAIDVGG